ncbi:hypothetical protein RI367_001415 [Sorochytrium milnesiophthora]
MAVSTPLRLFYSPVCPFAQRCTIAFAELGILKSLHDNKQNAPGFEIVEINLQKKPDWYVRDINPRGKVPAMEIKSSGGDRTEVLIESAPLTQYILEEFGGIEAGTVPQTAKQRYQAAMFVDTYGTSVTPHFFGMLRAAGQSEQQGIKEKLLAGVREVNDMLVKNDQEGPFALGAQFTVADVMTASFAMRLPLLEHFRQVSIPRSKEYERFHRWTAALAKHPSVLTTTASKEALMEHNAHFLAKH